MMKNNVLVKIIALILVACSLPLTACSKPKRVAKVHSAGSSVWVYGIEEKQFKIKDLKAETNDGLFYLEDYYVSEEGELYEITNKRGKTVASVLLAKKSETYNPTVYEFNLDEHTEKGIVITGEMDYVKIYSNDPSTPHDITILVDYERTKPCDIEFSNVNIQTTNYVSVLQNLSSYDLNIKLEGSNYFKSGDLPDLIDEYYVALHALDLSQDALHVALTTLAFAGLYYEARSVQVYLDTIRGKGTAEENFFSATKDMTTLVKFGLDSFESFVSNKKVENGFDGMSTFSSIGGIYFYGSGSATILGGNGTDGIDARPGVIGVNSVKGGDGGDGGSAIVANVLITNPGVSLTMISGAPGEGGDGAGHTPQKGLKGDGSKTYQTNFTHLGR
jgi:hypothetical protein